MIKDNLFYLLTHNKNQLEKELNKKLRLFSITSTQLEVLIHLWNEDGLNIKNIQIKMNIDVATLSGIIRRMVEKKFIMKKTNKMDKRIQHIYLSDHGKDLKTPCLQLMNEFLNQLKKLTGFEYYNHLTHQLHNLSQKTYTLK